jgi:hypothetical protein
MERRLTLLVAGTFRVLLYLHSHLALTSYNHPALILILPIAKFLSWCVKSASHTQLLVSFSTVSFFLSPRMSHSGSHTPTNNPTISNTIINPQSTVSRPQILDDVPSAELLIEDLGRPPVTPPSLEPPIAESSSKRRSASESSTEKPMAKRIRRESPETQSRASRHDSSSSEMQVEMVVEKAKSSQASNPTPPKKKRTRTLTTPQQFAVLQALLAKVSFFIEPP